MAGRMAAKNGSWFFSSSGLNCQSHSSALLLRTLPDHGRLVLLHSITGGRKRAAALRAGGLATKATRPPQKARHPAAGVSSGHPRMPGHWTCFAQKVFITVICLSCSSARSRSEISQPRMLDEAKLCNQEDPRRHSGGALTGDAQTCQCGRTVEAAENGAVSRAVTRLVDLG